MLSVLQRYECFLKIWHVTKQHLNVRNILIIFVNTFNKFVFD